MDAIYLDFQKAFDSVPHLRLLEKLKAYGFGQEILQWISSFLGDRTQHVVVNGTRSSEQKVVSGVPQGSVLGPLLFVLYINDLPDMLECMVLMFADDTKIFQAIKNGEDIAALQRDLVRLEQWSSTWLLKFHPGKCVVLTLGILEKIERPRAFLYEINDTILEHMFEERDLGVYIDSKMKFDVHIEEKIRKANSLLGLIRRSFTCLSKEVLIPLHKSLVRHFLEYGGVLWSALATRAQVRAVEKVQMRALEMIHGMEGKAYEEQLSSLKLTTLSYRRCRGMMIEMWKHFNIYEEGVITPSFQKAFSARRKLDCHRFKANGIHKKTFYAAAAIAWNKLPLSVRNSGTLNDFKSNLDNHWVDIPIRYDYLATPPWSLETEEEEIPKQD